jgi:uncharacterized damage-inducible protein DinB
MPQDMSDRFRRWFLYERDAHAKVIRSLETVPADRRGSAEYRRAVSILGHIAAARRVWLYRMGVIPEPPDALFPEESDLEVVKGELMHVEERWAEHLQGITDQMLSELFTYQSFDSGRFQNTIEDVLTQLFGHSWYHRGQIAILVRQAGGTPALADLIYFTRESV